MKDISNNTESGLAQIKTKLKNSCEKYCNVKEPKHQRNVINNIMKRNNIAILKQDKGSIVITDKSKYCTPNFTKA